MVLRAGAVRGYDGGEKTALGNSLRFAPAIAALSLLLGTSAPVAAAECRGVYFPDSTKVGSTDLVLNGLGPRLATIFEVGVYVAGLYLAQKADDPKQILSKDQAWRLVLGFVHDVEAADIREAFTDGFDKSTGGQSEPFRERIEAINALVPDLKVGDTLVFTHRVNKGIEVEINGTPKGEIGDARFAIAFLGISLGPTPPNEELKTGLLGGVCD
jgi:hypothetical protein